MGNSETEGRHGALGFEVGGQVMIWFCSSRCGLCTGFYLEHIRRNATELKRISCRGFTVTSNPIFV